jgi:16S rRNA G966 N2-methylase RsmD
VSLRVVQSKNSVLQQKTSYKNPELNQIRVEDRAVHDWYRFVLSFPPHLVQDYLEKFNLGPTHQVLDPFCGTGTTVVECKKLRISSVGIEANPMAWFAGSVKTDWSIDSTALLDAAFAIATATETALSQRIVALRALPEESFKIILKNSISPSPLHKTLVLLDHIKMHDPHPYSRHLLLALAKALVTSIGNLHFGPEVGISKAKTDAPVVESWLKQVRSMAEDLQTLESLPQIPATVHRADSRQILPILEPQSIDAVFTSPPYPNEKDYTRTTRLESVLLGFIQNKADLRALKEGLIRSNTRNVFKADTDDRWVAKHEEIQRIAGEIEARRIELGKTSGFERLYHRAVKLYFGGMAKHLADLRPLLRPGASLGYVVGDQKSYLQVMIRTGELLADIAQGLGYEVDRIDLFRTRLATATREQMREEIVILRWTGKKKLISYPFSDEPL